MMLQWRLCIKAIFLFFLKVLLIWKEDGMRCGKKKQNNNILLDVQYHLKAFLFFFFLREKVSEGETDASEDVYHLYFPQHLNEILFEAD